MTTKKDWQAAMENMKKEMMDGMHEYFDKMMSKLDEKETNLKITMKETVTKEIQKLETQANKTEKKIEEFTEENEKLQIMLEAKSMDR